MNRRFCLLLLSAALPLLCQTERGNITRQIKDASGAGIPHPPGPLQRICEPAPSVRIGREAESRKRHPRLHRLRAAELLKLYW